ncbi:MAG TPA: hypothetical protein VN739_02540 [Nitrososphaerales archaeon]|nr:hypothetical protein [Nitrososphaerales archaeon]
MTTPIPAGPHEHEFRYYACVNLFRGSEAVGVVDVWRCSICHVKGTELRVQGLNNLSAEAGFPVLDGPDTRWIVFACYAEEDPKFDVYNMRAGEEIQHECVEKVSPITVSKEFSIEDKSDKYHRVYNLDNYLNENLELTLGPQAA